MNLLTARKVRTPAPALNQRGSVLLEFTFVLPLLLLLTLCALEVLRTISLRKTALSLSRESANIAYRECSGQNIELDPQSGSSALADCLAHEKEKLLRFAQKQIEPGIEIIISYYRTAGSSTSDKPAIEKIASTSTIGQRNSTRFRGEVPAFTSAVAGIPDQPLFVAEIFIPYRPIVPLLDFFQYNLEQVYDATVV